LTVCCQDKGRGCDWFIKLNPTYFRIFVSLAFSFISLITMHGLTAAKTSAGISFVTTLPAQITVPELNLMPGQMIAQPLIHICEPVT
jgi:hypothetical protein